MEADALLPWVFGAKMGFYASALFSAGIGLHAAIGIIEREHRQRVLRTAAIAALIGVGFFAAKLLLLNAQLGGSLDAAFDTATMEWTWRAQSASALAVATGAAALVAAWLSRMSAFALFGALGLSASFAATGHTQALENPGIIPVLVAAHVLIASFWIAAPVSLWPAPSLSEPAMGERLHRFSTIALWAVPMLFVVGLYVAWVLTGGAEAMLNTTHGRLLIFKLGIATTALAIGAVNKTVITRMVAQNFGRGRRLLAATLTVDVALYLIALAIVGWATTFTGPPDT